MTGFIHPYMNGCGLLSGIFRSGHPESFLLLQLKMGKLRKLYRDYIYGIMGTLIFHILVFSFFLMGEINIKRDVKEQEIVIEIPVAELSDPRFEAAEPGQPEQLTNTPSDASVPSNQGKANNRPSNNPLVSDKFFDADYKNEIRSAQNLVKEVNEQLSRKPVDIEAIKMPVETTEGLDPEEVKNKNYSGDSNISYFLKGRYHLSLPVPVYLARGGGKVVVDILVNREGRVVSASPRPSPAITDQMIYEYARIAALRTLFNPDPASPAQQSGTIQYNFIPQ